jgi:hypothetical protein
MAKIKTFEQFSQAVEVLAKDKYFVVRMEKTTYELHREEREAVYHYQCYIAGYNWFSGDSPEEAIRHLQKEMDLIPQTVIQAEVK